MPIEKFISASMVICEKVLREQDGVLSAIRIVDVFFIPDIPEDERLAIVDANILLSIRFFPSSQSERVVALRISRPDGEIKELFSKPVPLAGNPVIPKGVDVPPGTTFHIQLNLTKRVFGTYIARAFLDGEEIATTPFTLLPAPQKKEER